MADNVRVVLEKNLSSSYVRGLSAAARRRLTRVARSGYESTYGWVHRVRVWRNLRAGRLRAVARELPRLWSGRRIHAEALLRLLRRRLGLVDER